MEWKHMKYDWSKCRLSQLDNPYHCRNGYFATWNEEEMSWCWMSGWLSSTRWNSLCHATTISNANGRNIDGRLFDINMDRTFWIFFSWTGLLVLLQEWDGHEEKDNSGVISTSITWIPVSSSCSNVPLSTVVDIVA